MNRTEYILVEEAARLEGVKHKTFLRRLERKRIILANDPEDGRRKLVPITAFSENARKGWLEAQTRAALEGFNPPAQDALCEGQNSCQSITLAPASAINRLQRALPFAPSSPSDAARDEVVAAVPQRQRAYVDKWLAEISENVNGTWKIHQGNLLNGRMISNHGDFICARASLHDVSVHTYKDKLRLARRILHDPAVPKPGKWKAIAESLAPRPRPGLSGHDFFADPREEVAWQFPALRGFYLNQARFSVPAAHRMLLDLIRRKQSVWGMGKCYPAPTLGQCRRVLAKIPKAQQVLAREGEKAFNDKCAAYLSRDPSSLRANDCWVTDQKEIDVRLRDGGERLGRIWMVSFMDVVSARVLGYAFGPVLSSDVVMIAVAMALERAGVPGAIHMDWGKEFNCTAFNGSFRKISGRTLYEDAEGLWNRLGVQIVKAIGRNPQSKIIERELHNNMVCFERTMPGYCGRKPDERPEILAAQEAQHEAWKQGKARSTSLITIGQFITRFISWVENDWNRGQRGRGRYRQGNTPEEAWNTRQPLEGLKRLTRAQLDYQTADHRFVEVARGGQVNLTFFGCTIEYQAPELFNLQGEQVEVVVSRRSFSSVAVFHPAHGGQLVCAAHIKPLYEWLPENRDELRAAMRCKAALNRTVRRGLEAQRALADAENPRELLAAQSAAPDCKAVPGQKLFGAPGPRPEQEISSTEFMGERLGLRKRSQQLTSEEVAEKAWQTMEEVS